MIIFEMALILWLCLGVGRWLWLRLPLGWRRPVQNAAGYAVLSTFAILFVGPFVWMLSTSLKTDSQVLSAETHWLPTVPTVKVHKQDENGLWQDVYQPIMLANVPHSSGPGDVIVEVQQEPVTTPADVAGKLDKYRKLNRKSVLMLIQSGDGLRWVPVPLQADPARKPG